MRCYDINTVKNTIKEYFRLQSYRKTSDACKIPKSTIHGWVKRFGSGNTKVQGILQLISRSGGVQFRVSFVDSRNGS